MCPIFHWLNQVRELQSWTSQSNVHHLFRVWTRISVKDGRKNVPNIPLILEHPSELCFSVIERNGPFLLLTIKIEFWLYACNWQLSRSKLSELIFCLILNHCKCARNKTWVVARTPVTRVMVFAGSALLFGWCQPSHFMIWDFQKCNANSRAIYF